MTASILTQPVCGCGTVQEAYDAALRVLGQTAEHDCLNWYAAVVAAHMDIAAYMAAHSDQFSSCMTRNFRSADAFTPEELNTLHARIEAAIANVIERAN